MFWGLLTVFVSGTFLLGSIVDLPFYYQNEYIMAVSALASAVGLSMTFVGLLSSGRHR